MARQTRPRGFSILELMTVVVTVGLLAAIAIPEYDKYTCRSRQSEVKANMKLVYGVASIYYEENGFVGYIVVRNWQCTGFNGGLQDELGFDVLGSPNYSYLISDDVSVAGVGNLQFIAEATGCGRMAGDTWYVAGPISSPFAKPSICQQ